MPVVGHGGAPGELDSMFATGIRTVHLGDVVCHVHGPEEGEMSRGRGEEILLLVIGRLWSRARS